MPLEVGSLAPAFRRRAHDGREIVVGPDGMNHVVVLYFYPKNETPGCTVEACGFRDHYVEFTEAGAHVVGVSADSEASHRGFAEHHQLPFSLVTDADGELRRRYEVGRSLGVLPGRVTFVIDRRGVVRSTFSSQLRVRKHVVDALRIVSELAPRPGP